MLSNVAPIGKDMPLSGGGWVHDRQMSVTDVIPLHRLSCALLSGSLLYFSSVVCIYFCDFTNHGAEVSMSELMCTGEVFLHITAMVICSLEVLEIFSVYIKLFS